MRAIVPSRKIATNGLFRRQCTEQTLGLFAKSTFLRKYPTCTCATNNKVCTFCFATPLALGGFLTAGAASRRSRMNHLTSRPLASTRRARAPESRLLANGRLASSSICGRGTSAATVAKRSEDS